MPDRTHRPPAGFANGRDAGPGAEPPEPRDSRPPPLGPRPHSDGPASPDRARRRSAGFANGRDAGPGAEPPEPRDSRPPSLGPRAPGCPYQPGGRPLPDPAAVRLCLVPDPAPPYDGAAEPGPPRADATDSAPQRGPRPGSPPRVAAAPWQSRFAQVLAETLAGARPPRQLAPWTTEQARQHIQRLGPRLASVQRPRVRRVVTCQPACDVMEMAVIVGFGAQVRALAVRLERARAAPERGRGPVAPRWLCTAVEAA